MPDSLPTPRQPARMAALSDAAVFLCAEWPVFPCGVNKRPLTEHGFKDASQDEAQVRRLFSRDDACIIGVPTGEVSDLAVWDFDTKNNGVGLQWLADNEHRIPPTRRHSTPSGGVHLLFRYPQGVRFGNSAGYLHAKSGRLVGVALGVDTRGVGGYICAPPSPGYEIVNHAMPAEMPRWMLDLYLSRKAPPVEDLPAKPRSEPISSRYAEVALTEECDAVAGTSEGGRNHQLNTAAFKLGTLVGAGLLSESLVRSELARAARTCGLDPRETAATIESGVTGGKKHPRQVQERPSMERAPPGASPRQAEAPPKEPTPGLPLLFWNDVQPSLSGDDFVEDTLIRGQMSVIYGPSNCGKTFWTSDLALHVATGRAWNGKQVEPGGVIYCALEGAYGIQNRVAAWRKHYRLDGVEVPFAVIPVALNLLDPEADAERLIEAIDRAKREFGVPVVWTIMDTLSRAMAGGNENSPEDMGALVTNGTRIQQVTGSHLSWIHHSGKDQAQGARGHSLLRAATDTEIEIGRKDKDSPSTAKVTKQREMEIAGEWTFTLRTIPLGENRRGKPVTSCVVEPADAPDAAGPRMSPGAKFGLIALNEALIKAGQPPVSRDIPNWARVVTLEEWRKEFYARSHLDSQDARRKAFQRAIKDLRDCGAVAVLHEVAWRTDDR